MRISNPFASHVIAAGTMQSPPDGYIEALYWRLASDWRRLATANLVGLLAAPAATVVFGALAVAVAGFNPPQFLGLGMSTAPGDAGSVVALIVAILATLIVHEMTHGVAIRWCGNRPSYGFQLIGLVPYATAQGQYFTRNQFVTCALAPLVGLSAIGTLVLPFSPTWLVPWLVVGLIANAAGAVGDVWMSLIALRFPHSAWIVDERDGMRVYVNGDDLAYRPVSFAGRTHSLAGHEVRVDV
jgi:hypothetical protein